jgi:hypothetical protein
MRSRLGCAALGFLGGKVYGPYERADRVTKSYLYMLRGERPVCEAAELMWPCLSDSKRRQFEFSRQDWHVAINAKNSLATSQTSYGIEHLWTSLISATSAEAAAFTELRHALDRGDERGTSGSGLRTKGQHGWCRW